MTALDFPTSPSDGDIYNDYIWVASKGVWRSLASVGGALGDLTDVNTVPPLAHGDLISYVDILGDVDSTFATNVGSGANSTPLALAVQSDGKVLVGGAFTTWNGTTVNRIVRLNADGTRDTSFTTNTGTGFSGNVRDFILQSDGKIVVVGEFTTFNGTTVNYIVRLNADGTRDTSFTTNNGTGPNNPIWAGGIQSDGKILIGGEFTSFNGTATNRFTRLNSNGSLDTSYASSFATGFNSLVLAIAVQSDDKAVVGGDFTTINSVSSPRIVRLTIDGVRDTTFNVGTGANATVRSIGVQSDGKILLAGDLTTYNGTPVNETVRVSSSGAVDFSFRTAINLDSGATAGLAGQIFSGSWRATLATGNVGALPLSNPTIYPSINYREIGENYGFIAIGYFKPPTTGTYTFFTSSDDYSGVWVGDIAAASSGRTSGNATVNNGLSLPSGGGQANTKVSGTISLTAGVWYPIRIVHEEGTGQDALTFSWSGPGIAETTDLTQYFRVPVNSRGENVFSFASNETNGRVNSLKVLSNDKILVGGEFTTFNGISATYLALLNSDGTRNTELTTDTGDGISNPIVGSVSAVVEYSDGVVVSGDFNTVNSTSVNDIVRLTYKNIWENQNNLFDSIKYSNIDLTYSSNLKLPLGYNGLSVGPATIVSGVTVTVPTESSWVIF